MQIISFKLPINTPNPSKNTLCGFIAMEDGKEIGFANMMFYPENTIKFEDAFVLPEYRRKGIYRKLWEKRYNYVLENHPGARIISYCKEPSLPIYKEHGFTIVEHLALVEKYT